MDEFIEHISILKYVQELKENRYVNYYPEICERIFSIPFLPIMDGNLLSYYQGVPLRSGLDKLLNHPEENIRKLTRKQLIRNEVVASDESGNLVPLKWWNHIHKENFKPVVK